MNNIDQYAVFGHPISHSKSPRIQQLFAQQTGQSLEYNARDISPAQFDANAQAFFAADGKGLNCTVPLKVLAWAYADQLSERARLAKAVNTLAKQADGGILGDNTDGVGLVTDLIANHHISLTGKRLLILGAGGASRGIIGPLLDCLPAGLLIVNRTIAKADEIAAEFAALGNVSSCEYAALAGQRFDLIINATSASLNAELPPLTDGLLAENGSCYDLAYGNRPTAFVEWGRRQQAANSLDGLGMLVEQAAEAFFIWRGIRPHTTEIIALLNAERQFHAN